VIIGADDHPSDQHIAFADTETGEHANGDWMTVTNRPKSTYLDISRLRPEFLYAAFPFGASSRFPEWRRALERGWVC
jgi:hypothetical protein